MTNKPLYPLLANLILRRAKRAELAMKKQRKQSALDAHAEKPKAPWRIGYDLTFNAPMSFSIAFAADLMSKSRFAYAPDESGVLGLPTSDLNPHLFAWGETGSGMTNSVGTTVGSKA